LVSGIAAFVTGYSGGTATDSHRLPFTAFMATSSYDGGILTRAAWAVNRELSPLHRVVAQGAGFKKMVPATTYLNGID